MMMYWDNPTSKEDQVTLQKNIKKGDLVRYKDTKTRADIHIATLYSDPTSCDQGICTYNIIHAYGGDHYKPINGAGQKLDPKFSREVLITPNNISTTIKNPAGFGRIKLWD